jgi:hypothetical protein
MEPLVGVTALLIVGWMVAKGGRGFAAFLEQQDAAARGREPTRWVIDEDADDEDGPEFEEDPPRRRFRRRL